MATEVVASGLGALRERNTSLLSCLTLLTTPLTLSAAGAARARAQV